MEKEIKIRFYVVYDINIKEPLKSVGVGIYPTAQKAEKMSVILASALDDAEDHVMQVSSFLLEGTMKV